MEKTEVNMWGVYPVSNLFYCKDRYRVGKQFIVACFYGFKNVKDYRFEELADVKNDIWYSCFRSTKDGGVLRYDGCCPDTVYYAKGGLKEYRTQEREEKACRAIVEKYPDLVEYTVKKDGHPYCRWKRQKMITIEQVN